jgi:hypothetical protein
MAPAPLRLSGGYPISGCKIPHQFTMPRPSEEQWDQHPKLNGRVMATYDKLEGDYQDISSNVICKHLPSLTQPSAHHSATGSQYDPED